MFESLNAILREGFKQFKSPNKQVNTCDRRPLPAGPVSARQTRNVTIKILHLNIEKLCIMLDTLLTIVYTSLVNICVSTQA